MRNVPEATDLHACENWLSMVSWTKSFSVLRSAICLISIWALVLGATHAQSDKISTSLLNFTNETEVIIHFEAFPGFIDSELPFPKEEKGVFVYNALRQHAATSQFLTLEILDKANIPYKSYCVANAIVAQVSPDQLSKIASNEMVRKITPNEVVELGKVRLNRQQPTRSAGPEWGLVNIGADSVWALGFRGQGVVIGGEDTGYDWTHPAIIGAYRGNDGDTVMHSYNWHDAIHALSPLHNDSITDPADTPCGINGLIPCDDHGHGTHTMGTMIGLDGENIIGVAPEAKWIGVRCMERGYGTPMTYIEGFEWFLAPTDMNGENPNPTLSPHVINNSWSCPEMEGCNAENFDLIRQAIINLKAAGIVVVVSAGNEGFFGCSSIATPPSIFAESFAVGATRSNDTIAGFSSRGPVLIDSSGIMKPDVSAPGVAVRSAWLDSTYRSISGTSMSGPHVAGAVALIISANPDLAGQVAVIEDIIRTTAIPRFTEQDCGGDGSKSPNNIYGHGSLNVLAAVEKALVTTAVKNVPRGDQYLSIFPNPSDGIIHLDMASRDGALDVRIATIQGNVVRHINDYHPGEKIDVLDLPGGVYIVFVKGMTNGGVIQGVQKLVLLN